MAKGLPKKYAKMGFKKGWKAYKDSKKKSKSKSPSKTNKKVRKLGKNSLLSPSSIFKFIRLGALLAPAYGTYKQYGVVAALTDFAGYDDRTGNFDVNILKRAWLPYLAATLVTYGIPKLTGMIRRIK